MDKSRSVPVGHRDKPLGIPSADGPTGAGPADADPVDRAVSQAAPPLHRRPPDSAGFSWLAVRHGYPACGTHVHHAARRTCCGLILHAEGRLRSIVDGRETSHRLLPGMVGFVPADDARHTVILSNDAATDAFLLLIPADALANVANAEEIVIEPPESIAFVDPVVRRLLERLRCCHPGRPDAHLHAAEIVRALLLRVTRRLTGRRPLWHDDHRPFDARTLAGIVEVVDAHLASPPRLEDVAARVGLSPSHCARKFRLSTGMSLGRFLALRRVQAALDRLHDPDVDLARLACDLGFSSQSHFTRTVSGWTGMTPARYRRGFRDPTA